MDAGFNMIVVDAETKGEVEVVVLGGGGFKVGQEVGFVR